MMREYLITVLENSNKLRKWMTGNCNLENVKLIKKRLAEEKLKENKTEKDVKKQIGFLKNLFQKKGE